LDALRFATVLSESGTDGSGGALEDVAVEVGVVLLFDPVRPTEALVAPLLVSQGFGGDGADMFQCVPPPRYVRSTESDFAETMADVVSKRREAGNSRRSGQRVFAGKLRRPRLAIAQGADPRRQWLHASNKLGDGFDAKTRRWV